MPEQVFPATGLPLAWRVETARHHESKVVAPLLDALHARGFRPETCAMDKRYDASHVYVECEERGVEPVVPLKGARRISLPSARAGRRCSRESRATRSGGATSTRAVAL